MTETSGFYTTSGTPSGHQVSSYTQVIAAKAWTILAACNGKEGVAPGYLNELVGSVPAANTARIGTGGAIVDGQWYQNDAAVDVTIPSSVGGGNTRIDRIVLRITWANFECVITRIAGVDAGSPIPPAITQTPGTVYDIMLYQALVNTSGVVTLTDERVWAIVDVDDSTIQNNAGELRIIDLGITTGKIANDAVDDTKVGNRVPMLTRRQGGSATNWRTAGITDYTLTAIKIQCGAVMSSSTADVTVTFPQAFAVGSVPLILPIASQLEDLATVDIITISNTEFTFRIINTAKERQYDRLSWIAIGPE